MMKRTHLASLQETLKNRIMILKKTHVIFAKPQGNNFQLLISNLHPLQGLLNEGPESS